MLSKTEKAKWFFNEGRVYLDAVAKYYYFTVRGKKEDYDVILGEKGYHNCTCKFAIYDINGKQCSHILAAKLVLYASTFEETNEDEKRRKMSVLQE